MWSIRGDKHFKKYHLQLKLALYQPDLILTNMFFFCFLQLLMVRLTAWIEFILEEIFWARRLLMAQDIVELLEVGIIHVLFCLVCAVFFLLL